MLPCALGTAQAELHALEMLPRSDDAAKEAVLESTSLHWRTVLKRYSMPAGGLPVPYRGHYFHGNVPGGCATTAEREMHCSATFVRTKGNEVGSNHRDMDEINWSLANRSLQTGHAVSTHDDVFDAGAGTSCSSEGSALCVPVLVRGTTAPACMSTTNTCATCLARMRRYR